jgi:hypothetical protein
MVWWVGGPDSRPLGAVNWWLGHRTRPTTSPTPAALRSVDGVELHPEVGRRFRRGREVRRRLSDGLITASSVR